MYFYQVKMVINEKNLNEFLDCLESLSAAFRKEKGYLDNSFYLDLKKENTYNLVGEWKTRKDMDKHFKDKNFSVLMGAAKVLGEKIQINIGENTDRGDFRLAKEKITLQPKRGSVIDKDLNKPPKNREVKED